jgi:glycosyltransferase involved in cell wall biosynthesis
LREYVSTHGLQGCVQFVGKLSAQELLAEYSTADVLLLASVDRGNWQENQACVVQEAMLCRALVAVSRTGGVPESTAPEMLPYSFPPEQPEAIAGALRRIDMLSIDGLRQLGERGRLFAAQRYDIRHLNRDLLATAERVLERQLG